VVKILDFKEMATAWALPENHCDTAHNRHGLEVVLNQIQKQNLNSCILF
jgi:hypothetical protein